MRKLLAAGLFLVLMGCGDNLGGSGFEGGYAIAVDLIRGPFIDNAAPAGGEVWLVASTQLISRNSADVAGNVIVQLSRDGGSTWKNFFAAAFPPARAAGK